MSFNTVRQPKTSPGKMTLAGRSFQISAAVASQLRLNLSSVLKLQGLTHTHITSQFSDAVKQH